MDDSLFDDQERSGNEPFAPFDTEMMSEQHHISFDPRYAQRDKEKQANNPHSAVYGEKKYN